MAYRSDLSIDWTSSPRIITVASPSVELTMQDLYDTAITHEALLINGDEKGIIAGSGKENLGGGTKVGITITLLNAKVAFEARAGAEWVLCSLIGGNLVAVDSNGDDMAARQPTAYTTIDRASSASATLQEQDALQYASYGGGVSIDVNATHEFANGTDYPSGSQEYPVKDVELAVQIAQEKGFNNLFIRGDYTLTTNDNITGFTIIGQNPIKTVLTIETPAITNDCEIFECEIFGVLDGNTTLKNCVLRDITYLDGYIYDCILGQGTIVLGNNAVSQFINCQSTAECIGIPNIDFGGAGQGIHMTNYSGALKLKNKTGSGDCAVNINGAKIIVDSTITNGMITIRGVGEVIDNSTGSAEINTNFLVNPNNVALAVLDMEANCP